jgi:hypothetical protein
MATPTPKDNDFEQFRFELQKRIAKRAEDFRRAARDAVTTDIETMRAEALKLADNLSDEFLQSLLKIGEAQEEFFKNKQKGGSTKEQEAKIATLEKDAAKALADRVAERMPRLHAVATAGRNDRADHDPTARRPVPNPRADKVNPKKDPLPHSSPFSALLADQGDEHTDNVDG